MPYLNLLTILDPELFLCTTWIIHSLVIYMFPLWFWFLSDIYLFKVKIILLLFQVKVIFILSFRLFLVLIYLARAEAMIVFRYFPWAERFVGHVNLPQPPTTQLYDQVSFIYCSWSFVNFRKFISFPSPFKLQVGFFYFCFIFSILSQGFSGLFWHFSFVRRGWSVACTGLLGFLISAFTVPLSVWYLLVHIDLLIDIYNIIETLGGKF